MNLTHYDSISLTWANIFVISQSRNVSMITKRSRLLEKQRPEVFFKKRCSKKFCKFHRKTPVPKSLF